jgi:hypothetical protein
MDATWEIHERYDGRYDIFTDGVLQHQGVPDGWLELQLAPHGITGDLYNDAATIGRNRKGYRSISAARLIQASWLEHAEGDNPDSHCLLLPQGGVLPNPQASDQDSLNRVYRSVMARAAQIAQIIIWVVILLLGVLAYWSYLELAPMD